MVKASKQTKYKIVFTTSKAKKILLYIRTIADSYLWFVIRMNPFQEVFFGWPEAWISLEILIKNPYQENPGLPHDFEPLPAGVV